MASESTLRWDNHDRFSRLYPDVDKSWIFTGKIFLIYDDPEVKAIGGSENAIKNKVSQIRNEATSTEKIQTSKLDKQLNKIIEIDNEDENSEIDNEDEIIPEKKKRSIQVEKGKKNQLLYLLLILIQIMTCHRIFGNMRARLSKLL